MDTSSRNCGDTHRTHCYVCTVSYTNIHIKVTSCIAHYSIYVAPPFPPTHILQHLFVWGAGWWVWHYFMYQSVGVSVTYIPACSQRAQCMCHLAAVCTTTLLLCYLFLLVLLVGSADGLLLLLSAPPLALLNGMHTLSTREQ